MENWWDVVNLQEVDVMADFCQLCLTWTLWIKKSKVTEAAGPKITLYMLTLQNPRFLFDTFLPTAAASVWQYIPKAKKKLSETVHSQKTQCNTRHCFRITALVIEQ